MKEVLELSLDEIGSLVKKISELLTERNIVLLQGDLGTGKTTLVKAISKQLGVDEVTDSPSFGLINEYGVGTQKLYHIDLYRLNSIEEFWSIGGSEYIEGDTPCFIEWSELIEDFIDKNMAIYVTINHLKENKRRYTLYIPENFN